MTLDIENTTAIKLKSISYVLTIGVSGIVICAIGSTMQYLALRIGCDATLLGGQAFLCRGIGTLLGTIGSAKAFQYFHGESLLTTGLFVIATILFLLPYSYQEIQVYLYFFVLGICGSMNDTGVTILTRRLHGNKAGPWLSMNSIAFSMSAAIVPIINIFTSGFVQEHQVLSVLVLAVIYVLYYSNNINIALESQEIIEKNNSLYEEITKGAKVISKQKIHYYVEISISFMMCCIVGGQVNILAFLETCFLSKTNILSPHDFGKVIMSFWVFVAIGRILGYMEQRKMYSDEVLIRYFSFLCGTGAMSLLLIACFPKSLLIFCFAFPMYSICFGPLVSFLQDINNRLTLPTELSTSIVMMGINMGASIIPFLSSHILLLFPNNLPTAIMIINACTMCIPLVPISYVISLSYNHYLPDFLSLRSKSLYDFNVITPHKFRATVDAIISIQRLKHMVLKSHDVVHDDHNELLNRMLQVLEDHHSDLAHSHSRSESLLNESLKGESSRFLSDNEETKIKLQQQSASNYGSI